MSRTLTKDEIFDLPVADLPLPESHQRALDEALADYRRDPDEGRSWVEVRDELFPKR